MKKLLLLPLLFASMLLLGGDRFFTGERAYKEGRFRDALEELSAAEETLGNSASPELLYNKALAAFYAGDLTVAEYTAEKAAARGGPSFGALCDFLRGNTAFVRCERAESGAESELEANEEDAGLSGLDEAIACAEAAKDLWQQAAMSRADWPEARRNVQRALIKLDELKKKKETQRKQQERDRKKDKKIKKVPDPLPQDPGARKQIALTKVRPQLNKLSSGLIKQLFDKLKRKEKEKITVRRTQRKLKRADVEKDW